MNMKKSGFTLVEIMIVVLIIGLLAAIAVPNFVKARSKTQTRACIDNMRQIENAIEQYAMEGNTPTSDLATYCGKDKFIKKNASDMTCPANKDATYSITVADDGTYTITCGSNLSDHVLPAVE